MQNAKGPPDTAACLAECRNLAWRCAVQMQRLVGGSSKKQARGEPTIAPSCRMTSGCVWPPPDENCERVLRGMCGRALLLEVTFLWAPAIAGALVSATLDFGCGFAKAESRFLGSVQLKAKLNTKLACEPIK